STSGANGFEGHLVHLELLGHGDRVGAVETGSAELVGGPATDRPHQAWDGEVGQGIGGDELPDLLHGAAGGHQLLGGADVDPHEAGVAHGWARDPDVDLAGPGPAKHLDDPPRGGAADDRVVDRDD